MYLPKKCSQVLEDDVASPAQLAKAYMGSRPSKVSPSMLGFRSQALREDSTLPSNILFPPSIVPKSPAPVGISEKGTMKVCCGKNMTRHSFTLLLVFQSSLLCLSVRVLHRHLMFMVDHHHLSLHWSKIEFLGLNKKFIIIIIITLWILLFLFAATKAQEFSPGQ